MALISFLFAGYLPPSVFPTVTFGMNVASALLLPAGFCSVPCLLRIPAILTLSPHAGAFCRKLTWDLERWDPSALWGWPPTLECSARLPPPFPAGIFGMNLTSGLERWDPLALWGVASFGLLLGGTLMVAIGLYAKRKGLLFLPSFGIVPVVYTGGG